MTSYTPSTAVYNTAPLADKKDINTKKCINCNRKCDNTKGHIYTINSLQKIIVKIDSWLLDNFSSERQYLRLGFSETCKDEPFKRRKVLSLKKTILDYYNAKRKGYDLLCNNEINNIISLAHQLTGLTYKPRVTNAIKIDYPKIFSSNCVPYEMWERALYVKAPRLQIKSKPIEKCMGFVYDIQIKSQDKEKANCFLYNISSKIEEICDINFSVHVRKEKCKIEYDLLVKKIPNCSIDYTMYSQLRESGFTKEIIAELEALNIQTTRDPETGQYLFTTTEGNTYTAESLKSIDQIINNI